ncbi:MAG: RHS repeat protein, partial [Agathobacter sp.]|nr:RHS repeat protein [Agathobacter sp.]
MFKYLKSFTCYLLTFAMLITLLPPQAYEASTSVETVSSQENYNDGQGTPYADTIEGASLGDPLPLGELASTGNASTDDTSLEDAEIVMELTDRRTEYSKEYKLDNGLNLAVVYSEPVHYKENGKWKEIDNTLSSHGSGASGSYKNKAGAWQVEFPQQLDEESKVKITKGDYTVSFLMSGELRLDTAMTELRASVGTAKASKVKKSQGKVHKYDYSKLKEQAQHPEVIRDNLRSRMTYSDVYTNTDVIYDLDTQQLKESIVINSYDPSVYGYVYTLDTGKLVPVLNEDGSVDLLTKNKGEVVMTMPAPFVIDNEGSICTDVAVTLEKVKGTYQLTYLLPMEWMEDENRAWPVVLDPVVKVAPGTKTTNIQDHFVAENYSASNTHKYLYAGHHATYGDMRTYIRFSEIPDFAACDVLVNAKLKLHHVGGSSGLTIVEAHQVYDSWTTGTITWAGQPNFNTEIQDYCVVSSGTECSWDVTDIAHGWYLGENTGIMLKATTSVENSSTANWKSFCSVEYNKTNTTYWPYLEITYLTSEGIEDYWDYTTASAGRAGSGYVNNTTGNLTWVHSDLGFDGNIMPVSISHIYTLSERSETKYGLGKGWRTNFHQTVALSDDGDYYIWTDGDGTKHHFISNGTANTYVDEDGLRLKLQVFSSAYTITDIYGNAHNFDRYGRLISEVDNQSIKSGISISYDGTSNRIKEIRDGVGRVYKFTYENNLLTKIGYHGKNGSSGTEITNITFTYSSSKLTKITYKDETDSHFTYDGTKLLTAMDIDDNKVKFTYSTGITKRIASVEELDGSISGNKITIDYAHNKTKLTDREHTVIHHYNDYGNLISTQDEEGNATFYEYKANKYTETSVYGNQLRLASKEQNTVANLSPHGSFEKGNVWHNKTQSGIRTTTEKAYIGEYSLEVAAGYPTISISAYGEAITVDAGKSCTFSAFVQSESTSVQIGLGTTSTIYESSSSQNPGLDWKRLEVSYTNTSKSAVTIYPLVINHRGGYIYLDGVQIEMAAGASRYNLVENGDFRISGYWSSDTGRTTVSDSAAPQLDAQAYKITGNPTTPQLIYQRIGVSGSAGDVYVLSGWAKGNSAPLYNTLHWFGIRVVFYNTDGSATAKFVSFNGTYDAAGDWEYTAGRVEADKNYSAIQVGMEYNNNVNDVYFDGIQLYREEFGERYDYDEDGNLSEVIDVLGRKTTYEYANNDLVKVIEPSGLTTVNTYQTHNLKTSTKSYTENGNTITLETYSYGYDVYGNQILAEVKAETVDDTGNKVNVVKRTTADYSTDRNHLASTTDELGNVTKYVYNQDTSVLEAVQYPKDTDGTNNTVDTRTKYEYDKMFRLIKTTTTTTSGEEMSVEYSYDPDSNGKSMSDMLTQVSTGSSVYTFTYGDFSLRKNVKVGTTILAAYTYLNDADHSLESVTYGNGDAVEYSYDEIG